MPPPDVLLLVTKWPGRALLRAELIETEYDVVAVDTWPIGAVYRQPGMQPRAAIIDLQGLAGPRAVVDELRVFMAPGRVLVITALGTPPAEEIRQMGYHALSRPTSIRAIVAALARMLRAGGASQ